MACLLYKIPTGLLENHSKTSGLYEHLQRGHRQYPENTQTIPLQLTPILGYRYCNKLVAGWPGYCTQFLQASYRNSWLQGHSQAIRRPFPGNTQAITILSEAVEGLISASKILIKIKPSRHTNCTYLYI